MKFKRSTPIKIVNALIGVTLSVFALILSAYPADADSFVSEEVLVSDPISPVLDPEFEPLSGQFAWVNRQGELWIGMVNASTGYLTPLSGKGTRVDVSAAPPADFYNGPEWALTDKGPQVVYTKTTAQGYVLAKAPYVRGAWRPQLLKRGIDRYGPYGSMDPGDSSPRIFYRGLADPRNPASGDANYWRNLDDPTSETQFGLPDASPGRWVPGARELVYTAKPAGQAEAQVFLLSVDVGDASQLTFTLGNKDGPRVWTAPDFGDARVLTIVNEREILELYTEGPNPTLTGTEWTLQGELRLPPEAIGPYIWNARPFVFGGLSYVVLLAAPFKDPGGRGAQTEAWIAGPLSDQPSLRRISGDIPATRTDPEILEIQGSPFVYLYLYQASDGSPPGIYKLATGL